MHPEHVLVEPASGGNRAFVFGEDATQIPTVPSNGVTSLGETCAIHLEEVDAESYVKAQERWQKQTGRREFDVVGQVGGQAQWIQKDETPLCTDCAQPMTFVVQLEEGHDDQHRANFGGGGSAYGFQCKPCGTAAFLWQS